MIITTVKTGAYTVWPGEFVPVDATSGTVAITLPAMPADGTPIGVKKIDSSTNTVTITCLNGDVFNKAAGSTVATLYLQNQSLTLQYSATARIWYVTYDDLPLSQLDTRYLNQSTSGNAATATKLATPRNIDGVAFDGSANVATVKPATVGQNYLPPGNYKSANYYFCNSAGAASTLATLGNNTARATLWVVTAAITVVRLFAEHTVAQAGTRFRIVIWNDDGLNEPGTVLLDAGTIDTSVTPAVQEITVSQALAAGIYWVGGILENAATQPTMRTISSTAMPTLGTAGTVLPAAGALVAGYSQAGMSGTAAGAFTAPVTTGNAARIGFKVT